MEAEIWFAVGIKTQVPPVKAKAMIANYLASGKKLSVLKKQLIKQGALKPQADTLKKSGAAKTQAEKAADVDAKADAGYTPISTPVTTLKPDYSTAPKKADYPNNAAYLQALKEWNAKNKPAKMDTGKPAPKKVEKEDANKGDTSGIGATTKKLYYDTFKQTGFNSYLTSPASANYEGLIAVQQKMQLFGHSKGVTLLQIARVIDEEGAKKFGVENTNVFEKKVITWLTTPEGTAHIKANEAKLAKQAEQEKLKAEAAAAAKRLEANQPPLPADSVQYEPWSITKARRKGVEWLTKRNWSTREQRDLKHYTGSAYREMNGYLRGNTSNISERSKNAIEGARLGMRPTDEPILVQRGTGLGQFSSIGGDSASTIWGITGKTFKDEGFLSTSAGGQAAFGGQAKLEIECPIGTPMAYVAPISKFPHENEMLLQAGMEYQVLNIRKEGGTFIVRMRVVNWPGKGN
jgi:hypothetical protein